MRIKVIFTGGTIGSQSSKNIIDVHSSNRIRYELIEGYKELYGDNSVNFDISSPVYVLSENMTINHWNIILDEFRNTDFSKHDGVIITHGTDTLGFSASMLSMMLSGIDIPVVLVSSNYILSDEKANGQSNFNNAVSFIKPASLPGVFAIYRDNAGVSRVYLGSRLKQCENLTDMFRSSGAVDFGTMQNDIFVANIHPSNPTRQMLIDNAKTRSPLLYKIQKLLPCVIMVFPYTGLDYRSVTPTNQTRAVLHILYHASTACDGEEYNSVAVFCKKMIDKGIDFYATPFKSSGSEYSSAVALRKSGALPLFDISAESTYAKLIVAYSTNDSQLRHSIVSQQIFFEEIN